MVTTLSPTPHALLKRDWHTLIKRFCFSLLEFGWTVIASENKAQGNNALWCINLDNKSYSVSTLFIRILLLLSAKWLYEHSGYPKPYGEATSRQIPWSAVLDFESCEARNPERSDDSSLSCQGRFITWIFPAEAGDIIEQKQSILLDSAWIPYPGNQRIIFFKLLHLRDNLFNKKQQPNMELESSSFLWVLGRHWNSVPCRVTLSNTLDI